MNSNRGVSKAVPFTVHERRILDATRIAIDEWGMSRFTVTDVCRTAEVSRATLYRLFPGGKEVLLEALHVRSLGEFFESLLAKVKDASSLEDLLVRFIVAATTELRNDDHLALMLATEPGVTLTNFTVEGMPRIVRTASSYLAPMIEDYVSHNQATELVDVLSRLVVSYFLAPSDQFDFADETSVGRFLKTHLNIHELINS